MEASGRFAAALVLVVLLAGCATPGADVPEAATAAAGGFSATAVFPGEYDTSGAFARTLARGPYAATAPTSLKLESRVDGAAIHLAYVLPDVPDGMRVPVVVRASPYLPAGLPFDEPRTARFADDLVSHGYAVALVALRGTAGSGGCSDLWGPKEAADVDQAVTWLAGQDWSTGAVGMIGRSYEGVAQWEVAALGNPHLRTIVPISSGTDPFSWMWRNGTVKAYEAGVMNALFYGLSAGGPRPDAGAEERVQAVACPEAGRGVAASGASSVAGEPDPFGYWAERSVREGVEANYAGSVLLVHGLQDWTTNPSQIYPWIGRLEANGVVVKHFLGQWSHAFPDLDPGRNPTPRWDWAEILLHWFDYWLKGDTTVDLGPRAQVQDSSGAWRSEAAWPPQDARPARYHLGPGRLDEAPAAGDATVPVPPRAVVPDPAAVQRNSTLELWRTDLLALCPACPWFETAPHARDFRFAGSPKVHVTVTPSGASGAVAAYLYAVSPDGAVQRLAWGAMDLRFADGGTVARPVLPGVPVVAKLALEPADAVVPAGWTLGLLIHQGGYGDNHVPVAPGPLDLHVGGDASVLVLDAFERGPDAFFTLPAGADSARAAR